MTSIKTVNYITEHRYAALSYSLMTSTSEGRGVGNAGLEFLLVLMAYRVHLALCISAGKSGERMTNSTNVAYSQKL